MKILRNLTIITIIFLSLFVMGSLFIQPEAFSEEKSFTLPKNTVTYLRHNKEEAQRLFKKDCTKCHSAQQALSRRTYQDWLIGITYRHGRSEGWIPEKDARKIFFHLVVHLEPEMKQLAAGENVIIRKNWSILLLTISGICTFLLLCLTFLFAHYQRLRRKWFKAHRNFAKLTFLVALFHGGLSFYLFVLK